VVVENKQTSMRYYFSVFRWLDKDKADGKISLDLPLSKMVASADDVPETWTVRVITGRLNFAGTDANVFINLYGDNTESGPQYLERSEHRNKFEKGQTDSFIVSVQPPVGELQKIRLGHDGRRPGAGWYVDEVVVDNKAFGMRWYFGLHRWLDKKLGDGQLEVETEYVRKVRIDDDHLVRRVYTIKFVTGKIRGAGTDANVFIRLFGDADESPLLPCEQSANRNKFEAGQTDVFKMQMRWLGKLQRVFVSHDGHGIGAGWYLDEMIVEDEESGLRWYFPVDRWLDKGKLDHLTEVTVECAQEIRILDDLPVNYEIAVKTGDVRGAGTHAGVFIRLYGKKSASKLLVLTQSDNRVRFQRAQTDTFKFTLRPLGAIDRILIGHDGTLPGAGWFLDEVVVTDHGEHYRYYFTADRWLDKKQDNGEIQCELGCEKGVSMKMDLKEVYEVRTVTGKSIGAGTDANVSVILFGELGDSGTLPLRQSNHLLNKFERGQTDTFKVHCKKLGSLSRVRIGHDNKHPAAGWFLDEVVVQQRSIGRVWYFPCMKWLDTAEEDGSVVRELVAAQISPVAEAVQTYSVRVVTGNMIGAGTSANVFCILHGDRDSDRIALNKSDNFNKFARAGTDAFPVKTFFLGEIERLTIGHDNKGLFSAWYLEEVVIECIGLGRCWVFPCARWFGRRMDDGRAHPTQPHCLPAPVTRFVSCRWPRSLMRTG
jgi:hypothetical protein